MKIELFYYGKSYIVEDEFSHGEEIPFIWSEGNYSCDCNRSLFIKNYCDKNFPEFSCGESIELKGIVK